MSNELRVPDSGTCTDTGSVPRRGDWELRQLQRDQPTPSHLRLQQLRCSYEIWVSRGMDKVTPGSRGQRKLAEAEHGNTNPEGRKCWPSLCKTAVNGPDTKSQSPRETIYGSHGILTGLKNVHKQGDLGITGEVGGQRETKKGEPLPLSQDESQRQRTGLTRHRRT